MTHALAAAPPDIAPFLMLPVADVSPSPLNPRKHFDPDKLQELAQTMGNGVGIIEPLVVRPLVVGRSSGKASRHELTPYELVAGERRWRAAQIAGLDTVPAVVKQLTDAQVLEIMVIENDQREDINPLEEGDGFRRLMKFGFDIDKLASRIGRSRKYIYDRVKLLDLVPEAAALLLSGRITAGHAILIARLTPAQQASAINPEGSALFQGETTLWNPDEDTEAEREKERSDPYHGQKARSVRELEGWIAEHCRFEVSDPVNVELFPQTAAAVEEAEKVIFITHDHHVQPDAKEGNTQRIYSTVSWKRADGLLKSKPCDRAVTGVIVVGPGRGEAFKVCVHKECDVHWKAERKAREKRAAGGTESADKYRKQQEAQHQKYERERLEREERQATWKKATPSICEAFVAQLKTAKPAALAQIVGEGFTRDDLKAAGAMLPKASTAEELLRLFALALVVRELGDRWTAHEVVPRLGKAIGVDVAKLVRVQASAAQPTPKAAKTAKAKTAKRAKKR